MCNQAFPEQIPEGSRAAPACKVSEGPNPRVIPGGELPKAGALLGLHIPERKGGKMEG